MTSAAQMAQCPPCGADAVLCCRAAVISSLQQSWEQGSRPEARDAWEESSAAQVFSTRRPRDAIAGASSGFKTFARSLAAGSAALVCTPLEAAREGGGVGHTLRGACEGIATAALLPCAGAVVAAGQFARGVAVTPQAFIESLRGQLWNDDDRCWKPADYSLANEASKLERNRRSRKNGRRSSGASKRRDKERTGSAGDAGTVRVHGREYYGLLRVNPAASDVEIRRAYYRESKRCHPDKAGTDPEMVDRFQQLSQAYQVLRNSELRQAYDAGGQDAVSRLSATIDLGSLYSAVLSGQQWEPYIGRLALARILSSQEEQDAPDILEFLTSVIRAPTDSPNAWQAQREVRCAQTLAERLQLAIDGDDAAGEDFAAALRLEADALAKAPFAPALMLAIADVYTSEAARFLGAFNLRVLTLGRELMQTRSQGRLLVQQTRAVAASARALFALRSLIAEEDSPGVASPSSAEQPRATTLCLERPSVQEHLPLLAIALWHVTVLDVEGTLRRVCRRVLGDVSVDVEARRQRAEALTQLAAILREAAAARGHAAGAGYPGEDQALLLDKVSEVATQMVSAGTRGQSTNEGSNEDT